MENNQKPEIRFGGFNENWELRKLGEVATILAGGDVDKNKLSSSGNYPVLANALTNEGIVGYYNNEYRIEGPAVTVTGRGDVGHAKSRKYNFTPVVRLLAVKSEYDVDFLESAINNHKITVESTGVPQLTSPQLGNYKIYFPAVSESEKIGGLLNKLTIQINNSQQELTTLKQTKQGFLQKMFPKEGETVPELRFPGFSEDWELTELKNVATFINGRAYKQNELLESGKYKVLRVGNFYTNTTWYYSDMELGDKYYANKGDLLYTWSASFGPHIWNGDKVIYHYHIWKVELKNNFDKQFIVQLLEYDKAKIISDKNGSTMVHITKKGMEEKLVLLPKIEEQIKIGEFFKQLDQTIELQEKELASLKETKKAFLQKMFV